MADVTGPTRSAHLNRLNDAIFVTSRVIILSSVPCFVPKYSWSPHAMLATWMFAFTYLSVNGLGPGPSAAPDRQSTVCRKDAVLDSSTVSFGARFRFGICEGQLVETSIVQGHGM